MELKYRKNNTNLTDYAKKNYKSLNVITFARFAGLA